MQLTTALKLHRAVRPNGDIIFAEDGHYYYMKQNLSTSAIGKKVFGAKLAELCGVSVAESVQVICGPEFLQTCRGPLRSAYPEGRYFGSRLPGDPNKGPIYDILPATLSKRIINAQDFSLMRTINVWMANPSGSQAVFTRESSGDYVACAIGFGKSLSFEACHTPPAFPFFHEQALLNFPWSRDVSLEAVRSILNITEKDLKRLVGDIPRSWWGAGNDSVIDMCKRLIQRQATLLAEVESMLDRDARPPRKTVKAFQFSIHGRRQSAG